MASLASMQLAVSALEGELVLAPLFPELASLVFAQLPVDSRLRCREVCRGWRAFLADARHWQVLDLSLSSGVARRSLALLRAASERAQGTLRSLDVSGLYGEPDGEGGEALHRLQLLPVLCANAASLLELRSWQPVDNEGGYIDNITTIEELLAAAPRLRLLEWDAFLLGVDAQGPVPRLLCEPQFAPLRLQTLFIDAWHVQPPPEMQALATWAATHASLKRLELWHVRLDSEPALATVADLAISQLQCLFLYRCGLSPASLPSLTRMLASASLTHLHIFEGNEPLLVGAVVPAFCSALRASHLVRLKLIGVRLWESLADGLAVIAACTGHPTLRTLEFQSSDLEHAPGIAAIEAALDALQASIPELRLLR